ELVVVLAEITFARLEQVELWLLLEVLDDLRGFDRFDVVHRLGENLERDVVTPRLVLGRLLVAPSEVGDELLGAGRIYQVMPHQRPRAEEVALARAPGD